MDDMKRTSEYRRMLPFIAKASNDVGNDTLGEDIQALIQALSTHKSSADHDGRYYTETEIGTLLSYKADKTLTLTAGDGLTGGGDLSANRTFAVGAGTGITVNADDVAINLAANLTWTGLHTFTQYLSTNSIYPSTSDIYDLGNYNTLWRKIWGSELSAIVFAKYEQVLLGGWLTISKGEGILPTAINDTQTQIDLGAAFTADDILVFRGISSTNTPQVEYMKVGTLVSGTTYNVTRNLDGTGANGWPVGTVFGNWGTTGNGRVELNAYDTPRMSVYSHGAAIADFREQLRFGDLNGGWGYSSSVFGGAFGSYETGKANITIDPTNGLRIRNYDQDVIKLTGTTASFENFITLGTNGGIRQGTGTWGSSFTGTAMWNESGVMNVGGWNAGVKQWWGGSDGELYGGGGLVLLNASGIRIRINDGWQSSRAYTLYNDANTYLVGGLGGVIFGTPSSLHSINLRSESVAGQDSILILSSDAPAGYSPETRLGAYTPSVSATISAYVTAAGVGTINLEAPIMNYTASGGHTFVGPVTATGQLNANGWTPVTGTFAYASDSTITVSSGGASVYNIGDRLKWVTATGSTQRYGTVVGIADTLLTIAVNTDHVLANEVWTLPYYSHQASPVGCPHQFNYQPVWTCASGTQPSLGNGTLTGSFSIDGTLVNSAIYIKMGSTTTYGTGIWQFSLPIESKNIIPTVGGVIYFTAAYHIAQCYLGSGTNLSGFGWEGGLFANMAYNRPVTWATNNFIRMSISYSI